MAYRINGLFPRGYWGRSGSYCKADGTRSKLAADYHNYRTPL